MTETTFSSARGMPMLPAKVKQELAELRLDLETAQRLLH